MQRPAMKNTKVFHKNSTLYADILLSKREDKGAVTADDAMLIRTYVKERTAQRSLSPGRQNKIILILASWRRFIPEYKTLTMDQLYGGLNQLSTGNSKDKQLDFSKNYIYDHIPLINFSFF
jgi:hypothetical protein